MTIKNYPFLSSEEFHEACHHLDSRYRRATLGLLRRRWRLRVCASLDAVWASAEPGQGTYLQITRPLDPKPDAGRLALDLFALSLDGREGMSADAFSAGSAGMDQDMIDAEEADQNVLLPRPDHTSTDVGYVIYEVHLHPTYRAPCLWFKLHGLPDHEQAFNIDTVFRYLVPDQFKDALRRGIGGISVDHHPLTGVPFFFVHPCMMGEAMLGFDCDIEHYLMVWMGLAGSCVGLWVPKEMAILDSA